MDHRAVRELNRLLAIDLDGIESYEAALLRVADDEIRGALGHFRDDHVRHAAALRNAIQRRGGHAAVRNDLKRVFTRGKVAFASLAGEGAVLRALRSKEDETNRRYEVARARKVVSGADAHRLIEHHVEDERRHRSWIVNRLEGIRSQFPTTSPDARPV